jgi:hypothetical protein
MYFGCFNPKTEKQLEIVPGIFRNNPPLSPFDPIDTYIIEWKTPTGWLWRRTRQTLPYPSTIRAFNGEVEFSVESEAYTRFIPDMDSITMNRLYNRSTIRNTVFN